MGFILLAVHKDYKPDETIVGFRIFDTEARQYMDASIESVYNQLYTGNTTVDGLEIKDNQIKGSNGNLDRYTTIVNGQSFGGCPIIITKEYPNNIYEVVNYLGQVTKMTMENIVRYASSEGLANAKIVNKENTQYISRIHGEFEKDKIFKDMQAGDKTKMKMKMLNVQAYALDDSNIAYCPDVNIEVDELTLGRGCLGIRPNGFNGSKAKTLVLPKTCINLGVRCCANMKNLTKIVLPEGITKIPAFMFENCTSLEEINLPNSITEISSNAFKGCNRLKVIRTGPRKPNIVYGAVPSRVKLVPRR